MRIKVIESQPALGQIPISTIVGNIYNHVHIDDETGNAEFDCPEFGGQIILNPTEYEVIDSTPEKKLPKEIRFTIEVMADHYSDSEYESVVQIISEINTILNEYAGKCHNAQLASATDETEIHIIG